MTKIIDNYIDRKISKILIAENDERNNNHKSSGKLSASMLGQPLQWQILKIMGIKGKEFDEYTLRKFKRGKDVELWLVNYLDNKVENDGEQDFVEYRGCVGYVDAMVDTADWDFPKGIIPVEIKSTSNAKFKRIVKGGVDRSHALQGALYALAKGSNHFAVSYVATDDLRVHTFILDTKDYKDEVDIIIDRFNKQLAIGLVPVFEAEEKWQSNAKYNNYPEWSELTEKQLAERLSIELGANIINND